MYYEINVSKNGKHFFATSERSITTQWELKEVYSALSTAFKEEDGYKLDVTRWESAGHTVTEEDYK